MAERVTVVIPVWNRRELLERTLATLRSQNYPIAEIVAVDNGSTDGAAELAEQSGARVIRLGSNHGFAFAVNRGIEVCGAGLIALINTDVELSPEWLSTLAAGFDSPDVWFATGKLLQASNSRRIDGTFDALSRAACALRVGYGCEDAPLFNKRQRIWLAPATAVLYRTELFRIAGVFDPGFESYLEDVDFSLRCAAKGLSGVYVPEAVALHHGSASLGRWHPDTVRRIARNQILLVAKHYTAAAIREHLWPILLGQTLWGLVAVRHGALWPYIAGKAQGIGLFRVFRRNRSPFATDKLRQILHDGEQEILGIQQVTSLSPYWRWYFRLTSRMGRFDT